MNRKREAIFMGIGVLAGLALRGPAAQAADYLTARPTTIMKNTGDELTKLDTEIQRKREELQQRKRAANTPARLAALNEDREEAEAKYRAETAAAIAKAKKDVEDARKALERDVADFLAVHPENVDTAVLGPPQYFAQYFCYRQRIGRKSKNPLSLAGQRVSLELLPRFEFGTVMLFCIRLFKIPPHSTNFAAFSCPIILSNAILC